MFDDFAKLDNLLDDDEESMAPTCVQVFYRVTPEGAASQVHVPAAPLSLRFQGFYEERLSKILQTYLDALANSEAASFLYRNRTVQGLNDLQVSVEQISVRVPRHIATAVYEKLDANLV